MTVEFTWRLLLFFIVVGTLQTALDIIVLSAWRNYARKRGWKPLCYLLPIAIACLMFLVFPLTVYLRQTEWHPSALNKMLHKALAVWYMPKIPFVVLIVAKEVMQFLQKRFSRSFVENLLHIWREIPMYQNKLKSALNKASTAFANFLPTSIAKFPRGKKRLGSSRVPKSSEKPIKTDDMRLPKQPLQEKISAELSEEVWHSRRTFLTKAVNISSYALAAVPVAKLSSDALFTLYDFDVQPISIPIKNLPRQFEGMRIVQLSDIHAGSFFSEQPMQEVVRIVESLRPDLVLVTGDWVNWRAAELPLILPQIQRLCAFAAKNARFGLWGSLGNHDHYSHGAAHEEILSTLRAVGVNLLINQNTTFRVDGASLQLAAIDNVGLRQNYGKLDKALETLAPEYPTILMAHDPTFWDKKIHAKPHETLAGNMLVDLTLSGHTHGGQLGLSLLGMDITPAALMYKQVAGLYADDYGLGQHIYVNRGIGTTGIPLRLGVPPEISLITLQQA